MLPLMVFGLPVSRRGQAMDFRLESRLLLLQVAQLALPLLQHFFNFLVLNLFFLQLKKHLLTFLLLVFNQLFFLPLLEVKILEDTFQLVGNILEKVPNIVRSLVVQENSRAGSAASGAV